jgi:hypothetical protein
MDRSNAVLPRLLLPFVPLVICGSFHLLELNLRDLFPRLVPLTAIALAGVWFFQLTARPEFTWALLNAGGRQTEFRAVYDKIGDKVSPAEKLLVAGSMTYSLRRGYMQPIYFGENARYLIDCTHDLEAFMKKESIRYVYFSRQIDRRIPSFGVVYRFDSEKKAYVPDKTLGSCLGFTWENYSHEAERTRLMAFLSKHGFKRIAVINGAPLFDRGPPSGS